MIQPLKKAGWRSLLSLLLLAWLNTGWAQAVVDHRPDPRQLFEKMRLVTLLQDYQGSITYEHDGQLSSFSLSSHSVEGRRVQDILALNGPERNFVHSVDACALGDIDAVRARITRDTDELAQLYNFQARGEFRIAGRRAQEIMVMPMDQYRYGYNFAIDVESGLMLHVMTLESNREILERFQFVQISEAPDNTSPVMPPLPENCAQSAPAEAAEETTRLPWRLAWLPQGFQQLRAANQEQGRVEMVYGDGLATFSIFIEPVEQVRFPPATTSLGATSLMLNYYLVQGETYRVTLVGEVPLETLQTIADDLHYDLEDADAG